MPPPLLLADERALDFLNSFALPDTQRLEWLGDGAGLLGWLAAAGLAPPEAVTRFGGNPSALDAVAAQARDLREWFRGFVARYAGAAVPGSAEPELAPLNTLLAQDASCLRVECHGAALAVRRVRDWNAPAALLQPVAESIAELLSGPGLATVRHCEGAGCSLWFRDVSARQTRRWCSMALCGNRAKAAAHRAKLKAEAVAGG